MVREGVLECDLVIYIDEAGDEGSRFERGSSHWFVLSAVALSSGNMRAPKRIVDEVRGKINGARNPKHRIPDGKALHFRDLGHEQRKFFAASIARADLTTISILAKKEGVTSPRSEGIYVLTMQALLERLRQFCLGYAKAGHSGCAVEVVLSDRSGLPAAEIAREVRSWASDDQLGWPPSGGVIGAAYVTVFSPGKCVGLQVADAVASSYFYAVEPSIYGGHTEDSYARLLVPVAWRGTHGLWGAGITIVPEEADLQRQSGTILPGWSLL